MQSVTITGKGGYIYPLVIVRAVARPAPPVLGGLAFVGAVGSPCVCCAGEFRVEHLRAELLVRCRWILLRLLRPGSLRLTGLSGWRA